MDKRTQLNVMYMLIALFAIMLFQYWLAARPVKVLSYSEFEQLLNDKQIEEIYVRPDSLEGKLPPPCRTVENSSLQPGSTHNWPIASVSLR